MSLRARRLLALVVALATFAVTQMLAQAAPEYEPQVVSDGFELVGHEPLNSRGMNAAPAVLGDYVYVGSRTDGLPHHRTPGILVVDVSDPAAPHVVHEIGPPVAGNPAETTRELRIWPQQEVLIVLTFGCSSIIHACVGSEVQSIRRYDFFDISGENAAHPVHVSTYTPTVTPHEFFLWVDPVKPDDRALMFWTAPTTSRVNPSMVVTDISRWRDGVFPEVNWVAEFEAPEEDRRLHSIAVSNDGSRTYLAFLGSGFLSLDTSEVADGVPDPEITYVIEPQDRVRWADPGAHTSVRLFGSDVGFTTDEVYGDALDPISMQDHGCPWGWMRFIDLSDEGKPVVISEYRVEENDPAYCESVPGGTPANTVSTSYASHNPTFIDDLGFVTWHSAGLEAVDVSDPLNPTRAGKFKPEPLPSVVTEDPALSLGLDKVVMWSYPIIRDGLIYVIDVRNGLFILRYTGPGAEEVDSIGFLEGNSNLGDALRYEPLDRCDLIRRQVAVGTRRLPRKCAGA